MVFDPKLQSDFAFNRPSNGSPSLLGTIGGLVGDFMSVEKQLKSGNEGNKPTADERFAVDFQSYTESKGAAFQFDRKSLREFVFKYPQHGPKAVEHAKNLGVMVADPLEQTIDTGLETYAKDPEFIVAAAKASTLPEEEREPYMLNYMATRAQEDAEIAKLDRDKKKLEAEGSLNGKRWDVLGNRQRQFADNITSTVLQPILKDVLNGTPVELTPEEQAQLGVRYNRVDMNNIGAVLNDTRTFLVNKNNEAYYNSYGEDLGMPPKEWEDRVLAGVDAMIDLSESFDTPQERMTAINALNESKATEKLDKAGLTVANHFLKTLPPELTIKLLTDAKVMGKYAELLVTEDGQIDPEGIDENAASMSKADAKILAEETMKAIGAGASSYDMFSVFKAVANRSGFGVVDGNSMSTLIGKSKEWMLDKANNDPKARAGMQDWFLSDINQTVTAIKRELPPGVSLSYQGGRYILVQESTTLPSDMQISGFGGVKMSAPEFAANSLPKGLKVEDLNQKLASLKLLGGLGQEVVDTVVNQELQPNGPAQGQGGGSRGGGNNTQSNGPIATKLGIDFGSIEGEYGLPQGFLERTAYIESRGNPNAKNPNSTAGGLFQQLDSNAKSYGVSDKFDPMQSTVGAAKFAKENVVTLTKVLGRPPTGGELYLAHQQGPGGASKLLSNPLAKAVDIVGADAIKLNGGNVNMTAGEFANIWISKFNGERGATTYAEATGQPEAPSFNMEGTTATAAPSGPAATGAPQESRTTAVAPLASPEVERVASELPTASEGLKEKARELVKSRPMDAEVKALIEALIGGKNV